MAKGRDGGSNHIKNGHLIGKGGGQVKKVDGKWAKGIPAKPQLKEHKTRQEVSKSAKVSTPKVKVKKTPPKAALAEMTQKARKPAKKTPPKAAIKELTKQAKPKPTPKKATPAKTKVKKAPTKGR